MCLVFPVSSALLAFLWDISILINMAGYRGKSRREQVVWSQAQPGGGEQGKVTALVILTF